MGAICKTCKGDMLDGCIPHSYGKKRGMTFEQISGGKGLVVKAEIREFLDVLFPAGKPRPRLDKLEILPQKNGLCHVRIRFTPSLYVVPYKKVLEAVERTLLTRRGGE